MRRLARAGIVLAAVSLLTVIQLWNGPGFADYAVDADEIVTEFCYVACWIPEEVRYHPVFQRRKRARGTQGIPLLEHANGSMLGKETYVGSERV